MTFKTRTLRTVRILACLATFAGASGAVMAQDLEAMLQRSIATQNQIVQAATNRGNQLVQSNMQNPVVLQAYRNHQIQASQRGQRPMDLQTFAYQYAATGGFSAQGIQNYYNTSNQIVNNERAAFQGLQQAQAARAAAQAGLAQGFSNNMQEAGRGLMGQNTFTAPNGYTQALPVTWQANTYHQYNGSTYFVDGGGTYWAAAGNGYWVPLRR